ncbi:MAG: hypothetical protein IKQ35_05345 [Bacilli bacterium]|nr:hypothetical protein [Bacilli bacterium]
MEVNLKTMPKDVLFQYREDGYVWKRDRFETRDGNYANDTPTTYTEIFKTTNSGDIKCVWSGSLTDNPGLYGENGLDSENMFHIFSFDQDCGAKFNQTMPLTVAPQELQDQALALEPEVRRK